MTCMDVTIDLPTLIDFIDFSSEYLEKSFHEKKTINQ